LPVPPPESPIITEISQDRLCVGDLLTIKGSNFKPTGDSVETYIVFENLPPIVVQPESDTKIYVTVPQGAKSGNIKVKTTTLLNGTLYELESNEMRILVIWKEYDLRQIVEYFNNYFGHGTYNRNFAVAHIMADTSEDRLFLRVNEGTDGYRIETFVTLKSDGTWGWRFIGIYWLSQSSIVNEAVDPISKSPALLLWSSNYATISAPGYPTATFQIYKGSGGSQGYNDWEPMGLFYDTEGRLYVLAYYGGLTTDNFSDDKGCIWRFERGDTIVLDPNSPKSLIPGGISQELWDFSVGPNGDVVTKLWTGGYYGTASILTISREGAITIYPVPDAPDQEWCPSFWNFAVDCRGTIYTTNEEYRWDCGAPVIYTVPGNIPLYTIPSDICGDHYPAVDGYGNIYIFGNHSCVYGDPDYPVIRRILPEELPAGYYDCFSCCPPSESARTEIDHCKNGVGDVNVCEEENLAMEVSTDGNNSEREACVILKENEQKDIDVLFGEEITLTFHKNDCSDPNLVKVSYSATSETVNSELPLDSQKSLFQNKPEIIFGTIPDDGVSQIQFQTVHTGDFLLEITPKQNSAKTYKVKVHINKPTKLGTDYNNYDTEIIKYADKYGIPPQYLKAHIHQEAKIRNGQYVADSFRYEPLGIDIGRDGLIEYGFLKGIWSWTSEQWSEHFIDYSAFNYPNGSCLSPAVLEKINAFNKITSISDDPVNPYHCSTYGSLSPPEIATVVDIYDGNDGWGDESYPNVLYGRKGPCSRREGWDKAAFGDGNWIAFHNNNYYCGAETKPLEGCEGEMFATITWFYNYSDIPAQIPVCSSYGLMQVLYTTAVGDLGWMRDRQANERDPGLLLIPEVSIEMGASFDADQMKKNGHIESAKSLSTFYNAIRTGLTYYNNKGLSYANKVLANVSLFQPSN